VRRDLFDDEQSRFLSDPALLERLATEKLEALAATVREEGWKWVEARLSVDSQALRQFAPCAHTNRKPTAAEQEELDALDRRAAELEQQAQALDDAPEWSPDEAEMIDLEEQDIAARRKVIHEALKTWAPEQKAHAGVIVTIGRDGDVEVMRGLVRDEDRKAIAAAVRRRARRSIATPATRSDDDRRFAVDVGGAGTPRAGLQRGADQAARRASDDGACRRCWRRTRRWPWPRWCMSSCCAPSAPTTRVKRRRCR
jgi:ParB family chromosome partitioning protein